MVSIKSLVLSTALLVAGASAAAVEKRGGGWGTATYYYQNGNPGACGNYASDSDYVVALNSADYDNGAHCGKTVWVQSNESKKIVEAKIADLCPSCGGDGQSGIDLSEGLFSALGDKYQGVMSVSYWF